MSPDLWWQTQEVQERKQKRKIALRWTTMTLNHPKDQVMAAPASQRRLVWVFLALVIDFVFTFMAKNMLNS